MSEESLTDSVRLSPYTSRKFILSALGLCVMIILPIIYKRLEISDTITLVVLGAVSGTVSAYLGFNVLQKKIEGSVWGS